MHSGRLAYQWENLKKPLSLRVSILLVPKGSALVLHGRSGQCSLTLKNSNNSDGLCISRVRASEKLRVTQGTPEVLDHITLENALSPTLGPPVHFIAFLCTSKHIYHAFSHARSNLNDLYTKIFRAMFGVGAAPPQVRHRYHSLPVPRFSLQ